MAEVRVYYCLDFVNEESELFRVRKKSFEPGTIKLDKVHGSQTTLKELYAKGFRVVSMLHGGGAKDQFPVVITVDKF